MKQKFSTTDHKDIVNWKDSELFAYAIEKNKKLSRVLKEEFTAPNFLIHSKYSDLLGERISYPTSQHLVSPKEMHVAFREPYRSRTHVAVECFDDRRRLYYFRDKVQGRFVCICKITKKP
jgi:hypothetical protein